MFRFITIFLSIIALFLPIFLLAQAQNTELFVTWQADSFVESDYRGKILPSAGGGVVVAVQLVDGNKPVNLAPYRISWFLDNRLLERGDGLDVIKFNTNPIMSGGNHRLKVLVVDYKGGDLQRIVTLSVARPEVIIKNPYPKGGVTPGKYNFSASFYGWNIRSIADLLVRWRAMGNEFNADRAVEIDIPASFSGQTVNIGLTAQNPGNDYERASADTNLLIK